MTLAINDYRDGCPVCGGDGRTTDTTTPQDSGYPRGTMPCPECERVAEKYFIGASLDGRCAMAIRGNRRLDVELRRDLAIAATGG